MRKPVQNISPADLRSAICLDAGAGGHAEGLEADHE
jgi:hypothetical protein